MRGRKLNRHPKHKKALMRNLITQLVTHERIRTTVAKAKELRGLAEKVIHKGKSHPLLKISTGKMDTHMSYVYLNSVFFTPEASTKVKHELVPRYANRASGFTRIVKLGRRKNDKAEMCYIEYIGK